MQDVACNPGYCMKVGDVFLYDWKLFCLKTRQSRSSAWGMGFVILFLNFDAKSNRIAGGKSYPNDSIFPFGCFETDGNTFQLLCQWVVSTGDIPFRYIRPTYCLQ
jgi:hypothetical protein